MVNTYRLMSKVLIPENGKYTNEELAIIYQENRNPSILAEIFCRNFSQWLFITNKRSFYRMDNEDKVSIVLDKLDKALTSFDITKGYKFTTYANRLIILELTNKKNYFNHYRRNDVLVSSLYENSGDDENYCKIENEASIITDFVNQNEIDMINLKQSIQESNLSEKEKLICDIILDNPGITDLEISDMMKVHRHTVRNLKLGLKSKIKNIIAYN